MTAATDPFEAGGLTLHTLVPGDSRRGAALSAEIGWNQTEDDWRYMLANGEGFGRTNADGKLVASAMALPYESFAWVCMVLVSPDYRRRGLATDLMRRVIDDVEERGMTPGLDATPAGREVYRLLGFEDIYGLARLWATRVAAAPEGEGTLARIAPMTEAEIDEVAGYDAQTFGADRRALLAHLRERQPDRAFVARVGEWLAGYVLARDGREAIQVGPIVAEDSEIAIALARHALEGYDGAAVIDVMDYQTPLIEWFKKSGFEFQRPYIRMLLGRLEPIDQKDYVFAPAGPELG